MGQLLLLTSYIINYKISIANQQSATQPNQQKKRTKVHNYKKKETVGEIYAFNNNMYNT